jgi:hypothetical protein
MFRLQTAGTDRSRQSCGLFADRLKINCATAVFVDRSVERLENSTVMPNTGRLRRILDWETMPAILFRRAEPS